jgi:hypothetical protein
VGMFGGPGGQEPRAFIHNPNAAPAIISLFVNASTCNCSGQNASTDVDSPVPQRKAYQLRSTKSRFGGAAGVIVDVQQ